LTNAHVALSAGIQALVTGLPQSFGQLFASPRGKRLIAWDDGSGPNGLVDSGFGPANPYELCQIDTDFSILTPIPIGIPALLAPAFLYTDVAAGPVRPANIPGVWSSQPIHPIPLRTTVRGAHLGASKVPVPGETVYKVGSDTGTVWGRAILAGLVIVIPIPPIVPLLPAQMLIFNLNLYDLAEGEGDSGSVPVARTNDRPTGVAGLGLGAFKFGQVNSLTLATPTHIVRAFANVNF
jgi:hypothetical protein